MLYYQPHVLENMSTNMVYMFTIHKFIDHIVLDKILKGKFCTNNYLPDDGISKMSTTQGVITNIVSEFLLFMRH